MRTLLFSILALVAISFASPAFATSPDCDHGSFCAGDDQTVNQTTNNNPTANGGAGGAGGQGGAGGLGGSSTVGGGSHSFSPSSDADGGDVEIGGGFGSSTLSPSSDQDQDQKQGQLQGQQQGQFSDDDFVIQDNSETTYEAARIPVNSAAPVFASGCSQGVSAQMPTFGASVGSGNPVCDRVAIAGAYIAAGSREDALRVLADAEDSANWRSAFSKIRGVLTLGLF